MDKELFACVVATPEICDYLTSLLDCVSDHLRASDLCTILHYESSDIFASPFVEPQNPNSRFLAAFAEVCKF